jgi:hypothetical protein
VIENADDFRLHPLQGPRAHRVRRRTAQALQASRTTLRIDRLELQINRQFRRRLVLDQTRRHSLVLTMVVTPELFGNIS